jgi:sugar phosphate isomerase/epimerase
VSYPRIYLAVNNCFASKRWTVPEEWIRIIRKWGIRYIEASADVEADPLYGGHDYLRNWEIEVGNTARRYDISISSIYTGHGTYSTLGLTHTSEAVQRRMQEEWLKPMINTASNLGARFGFFCHAIPQTVLHDALQYRQTYRKFTEHLSYLAVYAREQNLSALSIEQMYTPHQPPWTINGTRELLARVHEIYKAPLYVTIDTGHATGQRRFLKPKVRHIASALRAAREKGNLGSIWLGTKAAYDLIEEAAEAPGSIPEMVRELRPKLRDQVDRHPWLFASEEDGDIYRWIEELGAFSPVIHLQQTDGRTSAHLPFTTENNLTGIIDARKFLNALTKSYQRGQPPGLPPMCNEIFLTLEIFSHTAQRPREILDMMRHSVEYWRKYIPDDGTSLDLLLDIEEPIEEIRRPGWMLP